MNTGITPEAAAALNELLETLGLLTDEEPCLDIEKGRSVRIAIEKNGIEAVLEPVAPAGGDVRFRLRCSASVDIVVTSTQPIVDLNKKMKGSIADLEEPLLQLLAAVEVVTGGS
jgi:hypothetical protein